LLLACNGLIDYLYCLAPPYFQCIVQAEEGHGATTESPLELLRCQALCWHS
jgi:hypothetical protein